MFLFECTAIHTGIPYSVPSAGTSTKRMCFGAGASTTSWFALWHSVTRIDSRGSHSVPELTVCQLPAMPVETSGAMVFQISNGSAERIHVVFDQ